MPDRYCGLEPNQWLVEAGLEREIGADLARLRRPVFRHESDFTLRKFGRRFDYIIAQSVFSHAARDQIATCLREAKEVLAQTGLFAATYRQGDTDYAGQDWVYPECVEFTPETIDRLAEQAGLGCYSLSWGNQNRQRWVVFHHPEHADALPGLDDATALRAEVAVLRGRVESSQRAGISPADYARLEERLLRIAQHPAVRAAMAEDSDLRAACSAAPESP